MSRSNKSKWRICPFKATIYELQIEVEFTRRKQKYCRKTWAISCFTDPEDLLMYDKKTLSRIKREFKFKDQAPVIRVLSKREIGKSQLTLDEHKRSHRK